MNLRKRFELPVLYSPLADTLFIFFPPLLTALIFILLKDSITPSSKVPLLLWILCATPLDAGHVLLTFFKTYGHPEERKRLKKYLIVIPVGMWLVAFFMMGSDAVIFGNFLAYMAIFHFVSQQVGFVSLYRGRHLQAERFRWIDKGFAYLLCLYPLAHWQSNYPKKIFWFHPAYLFKVPGVIETIALSLLITFSILYIGKEYYLYLKKEPISISKQLILLGTGLNWYLGIVYFNNYTVFFLAIVITHTVPYTALIWFYGRKEIRRNPDLSIGARLKFQHFFSGPNVIWYFVFLCVCGLLLQIAEVGFFGSIIPEIEAYFHRFEIVGNWFTASIVATICMFQFTHYILDGIIWKKYR